MNKYINKHKKQMQQKLRNLKHKNPKEFWEILNNIERKEDEPDISIDTLYEYFKNLNINNDGNDTQETINIDITDDDEILNSSITEGEIIKCIKSLKNNNSSANDRIINEYIKNSSYFQNERKDLLKRYYYLRPNTIKYQELMNCKNKQVLLNLSKFMKLIISKFV